MCVIRTPRDSDTVGVEIGVVGATEPLLSRASREPFPRTTWRNPLARATRSWGRVFRGRTGNQMETVIPRKYPETPKHLQIVCRGGEIGVLLSRSDFLLGFRYSLSPLCCKTPTLLVSGVIPAAWHRMCVILPPPRVALPLPSNPEPFLPHPGEPRISLL